jgi:hypothetical protein
MTVALSVPISNIERREYFLSIQFRFLTSITIPGESGELRLARILVEVNVWNKT